ncbi:MAG: lipid A biosynthesis lauroyl acyltransferase [Rhodoplanes sp.]
MSVFGMISLWVLRMLQRLDLDRSAGFAGWLMRRIGPWLRGHRVAQAQLAIAFPEKTEAERAEILAGMWDNLGRLSVEYAHLDRLWDYDPRKPPGRIFMDSATAERFARLRDERKPALMFTAHLANWELVPLGGPDIDREVAVVFRAPPVNSLTKALAAARSARVGAFIPAGPEAPFRIRDALKRNWIVGMLIDQHAERGVEAMYFGRPCMVNPMLARFARRFECPIYGARVVRLPNGRFRFDLTAPLDPPRAADGRIDIAGTMQLVTSIIEGWVREHPEQWFWIHRRWR